MPLFTKDGHQLERELDKVIQDHASAVEKRHETVSSRLAELEAEKAALGRARRRHAALQAI